MGKIIVFTLDGNRVEGEFAAHDGDYMLVLGKGVAVHAWRDGKDCCNLIGAPCPLSPMTGYSIPTNPYTIGAYSIGATRPSDNLSDAPVITNGTLNVGSGPGDGDHHGRGRRRD